MIGHVPKKNRPEAAPRDRQIAKFNGDAIIRTPARLGLKAPPQKAEEADTALAAAWRKALARKGGAR